MERTKIQKFKRLLIGCVMLLLSVISVFSVTLGTHTAQAAVADVKDKYTGFDFRTTEFKITDKGALNNPYDVFPWSKIPLTYESLVYYGFKYVTVSVSMDMREEDDGYQHVYLYRDLQNKTALEGIKYAYGDVGANKNYGRVTFNFKSLYLSEFVYENNLSLIVRYDASGAFSDDWYNKNVKIEVTVSMGSLKSGNSVEEPA